MTGGNRKNLKEKSCVADLSGSCGKIEHFRQGWQPMVLLFWFLCGFINKTMVCRGIAKHGLIWFYY
jgi:hypothetical protein